MSIQMLPLQRVPWSTMSFRQVQSPPQSHQHQNTVSDTPSQPFILARFCAVANHGRHWAPRPFSMDGQRTPEGPATQTPAITDESFWAEHWNDPNGLSAGLDRVTDTSPDHRRPADRMFEALGSTTNPYCMVMTQDRLRRAKSQIESFIEPMSNDALIPLLYRAAYPDGVGGGDEALATLFAPLDDVLGVFEYVRDPRIASYIDMTVALVGEQLAIIEEHFPVARGLEEHWHEFYRHYFAAVSAFARQWATGHIAEMRAAFETSPNPYARDEVLEALDTMEEQVSLIRYSFED